MGNASSQFYKFVKHGDEAGAVHLLNANVELCKALNPNTVYKGSHYGNTVLHNVCQRAMVLLVRKFLSDMNGNPNKTNDLGETSVHSVCSVDSASLTDEQKKLRLECLTLLLDWEGPGVPPETADLMAADCNGNTALHCAATSGLKECIELLVERGAPLYIENKAKETPCDSAEKMGHSDIAVYLESKMVFSADVQNTDDLDGVVMQMEADEGCCGLRAQDLQETKDQLLVETADMLQVPLFTAEALLRSHEWSRELLLESWIVDPTACCFKSGVNPPKSLTSVHTVSSAERRTSVHRLSANFECAICTEMIASTADTVPMECGHNFCRDCWEKYLCGKIQDGEAHSITCPAFDCDRLVPIEIIETVVSRDMARRYLQFDIAAFVDSNPAIKWCPHPGCGQAVRLPDSNLLSSASQNTAVVTSMGRGDREMDWSRSVSCGKGHNFCWDCMGDAHDPASCENWKNWHQKIAEVKPEELNGTEEQMENSANCLWLVTNSKPCSNCKSPIQKSEGCNHIKCSKCKHDFCWVCLESWKKHSTATGGYFRCNRYEAVKKVEEHQDMLKTEAELKNKKVQELNRFVHYYTRFKNHENSYKLEIPLYKTAKEKMKILAQAVMNDEELIQQEIKFIQEAVTQLLKARHVLKCSYVYGYYLEPIGYKKAVFEFMQTELEECTEMLSQMSSRSYLRTPRSKIVQTAQKVQRKRLEFLAAIAKGLVPSDSSPSFRKKNKIFSVEVDEGTRKVLLASLNKNPKTSWVKGPSGKHTNVSALLDWPDDSDDSDPDTTANSPHHRTAGITTSSNSQSDSVVSHAASALSGTENEVDMTPAIGVGCEEPNYDMPDYNMDLLRALEMSRIQYRNDTVKKLAFPEQDLRLSTDTDSDTVIPPVDSTAAAASGAAANIGLELCTTQAVQHSQPTSRREEEDLYFAIQLSMRDMIGNPNSLNSCSQLTHDPYSLHPDGPAASRSVTDAIASSAAAVTSTSDVDDNSNCNVFGVIKDIRINNIIAADADKTCQFEAKNFKQLFNHTPGSSPVNGLAPNLNHSVCDNNVSITRNEIDDVQ